MECDNLNSRYTFRLLVMYPGINAKRNGMHIMSSGMHKKTIIFNLGRLIGYRFFLCINPAGHSAGVIFFNSGARSGVPVIVVFLRRKSTLGSWTKSLSVDLHTVT